MRAISLQVAILFGATTAALAAIPSQAGATVTPYGVGFEREFLFIDPRLGSYIGTNLDPSGVFFWDDTTNRVTSFRVQLGIPSNDFAPIFNGFLDTQASCDLTCFSAAIDGASWSFSGNGNFPINFTSPLSGSVNLYTYAGNPPYPFTYGGTVRFNGAVPEPSTWALMLLGFGGTGVALRRRRRVQKAARPEVGRNSYAAL